MLSTTPAPQNKDSIPLQLWLERHYLHLARLKEGPVELLFLGDSITQGWEGEGKGGWDRHFAKYKVANFGIGGDETSHVLWRLGHGEIDGISPKLIVLLIGTNNLGNSGQSANEIIAGIRAVVGLLRERLPSSKILLHAVLPRDAQPGTPFRKAIAEINANIHSLTVDPMISWLDMTDTFLAPDGTLPTATMPDGLHLSPAAYDAWAAKLAPMVAELMAG